MTIYLFLLGQLQPKNKTIKYNTITNNLITNYLVIGSNY